MYRLPDALRPVFQKPFGPVRTTEQVRGDLRPGDIIVAIGDLVAKTALDLGLEPKLIIVDYQTQRGPVPADVREALSKYGHTVLRVVNPAATVTNELFVAVAQGLRLRGPVRIEVDGEEDLAGLPVFDQAPEGAVVLYGMPNQGIVVVRVDAEMKRKTRQLLQEMKE